MDTASSPSEVFSGISIFNRHALRANNQVGNFTREIRRQSAGVDRAIAATRDSVGRDTVAATADSLRGELVDAVMKAMSAITQEIGQIATRIDTKAKEASRLVNVIDGLGATIKILSLNASIEAASAGDHGRGFAVIAAEVRALANETLERARNAAVVIDFSDVRTDMAALRTSIDRVHESLGGAVRHTADRIETLLERVGGELMAIGESNAAIDEALNAMHICVDRTDVRTTRSLKLTEQALAAVVHGKTPPDVSHHGIAHRTLSRDLLDDIIERGQIRVALDPNIRGLSFRKQKGARLVGLDVAYAEAFADFLGVKAHFVECAWDQCTELVWAGRDAAEPPADIVWSGLPPNADFDSVAYSRPYTYLNYVLVRRLGDLRINGLSSLEGRTLGIVNDPSAYATLQEAGLRWADNLEMTGRRVATLGSLIALTDIPRIYEALADGVIDALTVDNPVVHWACIGAESPWRGRLEIVPGNIAARPWYYSAAVADHPASCRLLMAADAFIETFTRTPQRLEIEHLWQGAAIKGTRDYTHEAGSLRGAKELTIDYRTLAQGEPTLPDSILRRVALRVDPAPLIEFSHLDRPFGLDDLKMQVSPVDALTPSATSTNSSSRTLDKR